MHFDHLAVPWGGKRTSTKYNREDKNPCQWCGSKLKKESKNRLVPFKSSCQPKGPTGSQNPKQNSYFPEIRKPVYQELTHEKCRVQKDRQKSTKKGAERRNRDSLLPPSSRKQNYTVLQTHSVFIYRDVKETIRPLKELKECKTSLLFTTVFNANNFNSNFSNVFESKLIIIISSSRRFCGLTFRRTSIPKQKNSLCSCLSLGHRSAHTPALILSPDGLPRCCTGYGGVDPESESFAAVGLRETWGLLEPPSLFTSASAKIGAAANVLATIYPENMVDHDTTG